MYNAKELATRFNFVMHTVQISLLRWPLAVMNMARLCHTYGQLQASCFWLRTQGFVNWLPSLLADYPKPRRTRFITTILVNVHVLLNAPVILDRGPFHSSVLPPERITNKTLKPRPGDFQVILHWFQYLVHHPSVKEDLGAVRVALRAVKVGTLLVCIRRCLPSA